jgi:hypothetical protein
VKQKSQASAAFLGVMTFPRKVVGVCCISTTILADFAARRTAPERSTWDGLADRPAVIESVSAERPANKKAAATVLRP